MTSSILPSASDFSTFGGLKQDYTEIVDPLTDRSAEEINAAFATLSSATRTSLRCYCQFTGSASTPTIDIHNAVWGNSISVIPILSRTGTGAFTVSFPASVVDSLGQTQSVNLIMGWGNVESSSDQRVNVVKVNSTLFNLFCFEAGVASDLVGSQISVFII